MTVRKRGKTWQAQVRVKENGVLVYSESATRDTKAAATLWKLQRQEEIRRNGWRKVVVSHTTLAKLLEMREQKLKETKGMGRGMEHSFAALQMSELGPLTLPELTSAGLVEWGTKLHKAGNAPATVMHHFAILRAALKAAKAMHGIEADAQPVVDAIAQLKLLRVAAPSLKREQRVTDEDLAAIIPAFEHEARIIPMDKIVPLAIAFPRRREELCSMLRENLAKDGSTIKLVDTKDPRKYREEIVPVPPAALAIIEALGDDARIVPYKPESISAAWQRAVRRVGKPHLRFHDLRHEGICRLFEAGLDIQEVAMISGHTSWATLKRYTHLRPQDVTAKLGGKGAKRKAVSLQEVLSEQLGREVLTHEIPALIEKLRSKQ